ncbi:hypothetical protein GCM10023116_26210 [Kistimonas scapharcae]|uniref:Uncharacterized protein n=1 Tax=Kistimonas scapharcae TaxID=1036133 RepID=A0ABP8V271_9GAMM
MQAAKKALEKCDHMLLGDSPNVNLMAHVIGNAESFSIGDFVDVGQVVEDYAGASSTVICGSNISGEFAIGEYEVIVTVVVS